MAICLCSARTNMYKYENIKTELNLLAESFKEGSRLAALYKFTSKAPKAHGSVHQDFGSSAIRILSDANQSS